MTLRQTLLSNTVTTNEAFAKLINTSNQAVKTRESVFADLSRDVRLYVELEEEHLFPALRKNPETKNLVPDATKSNKELLAALQELEVLPKGDNAFIPRITELRKLYQQHLRDERKELLPVIEKALSDAEAQDVVSKIDAATAAAEERDRVEAEQRKLEAKAERDRAKEMADCEQALAKDVEATKDAARDMAASAADAVKEGARTAETTVRKAMAEAATAVAHGSRRVSEEAAETVTVYRVMAREGSDDVKAVASAARTVATIGSEMGSLWLRSLTRAGRNGVSTSFRLMRHPLSFVQTQREFVVETRRNLLETSNGLLQIACRASGEAVRPLEERLKAV